MRTRHLKTLRHLVDGDNAAGPSFQALWMANCPTGPQPQIATISPFSISAFSAAIHPVGKISERNNACSSGMPSGTFIGPTSA
jgi:hypothetical protein